MNSTRVADFQLDDWLPHWLPPDILIGGVFRTDRVSRDLAGATGL
jgi:hypothetical protein